MLTYEDMFSKADGYLGGLVCVIDLRHIWVLRKLVFSHQLFMKVCLFCAIATRACKNIFAA